MGIDANRVYHLARTMRGHGVSGALCTLGVQTLHAPDAHVTRALRAAGCEAVCVFFVNGYANADNERQAVEAVRSLWPNPYVTAGHWTYAEDTSWVWVSDYDWGWVPFHYGRWVWAVGAVVLVAAAYLLLAG